MSLYLSWAALGLQATVVVANPIGKRSIAWNACEELNKNISTLMPTLTNENFEPFQCAKLSVPLDYTGCEPGELELDLFRIPATKEPALGTVLWNPGGPGGTAPPNMPPIASDFRAHVGEQWNILSWDPRGTGNTIPFVCPELDADPSQGPARKRDVSSDTFSRLNSTEVFLNEGWEAAGDSAAACVAANNKTAPLIGTAFVARDMIEILDALGEDGLLRFYGSSYGTALGSYFAAMFPDRVDRMVLDANIDPSEYRDGHMGDYYRDADAAFEGFLDECYKNKDECALAEFVKANSTQDLVDVVNLFFEPLAANASKSLDGWMTYSIARGSINPQLYYPSTFPALAEYLVGIMNSTGESTETGEDEDEGATEAWSYDQAQGAFQAIRGADATLHFRSAEDFLPIYQYQTNASSLADTGGFAEWQVAQWPMRGREQFHGNFTAKTRHPILYVNGEYDPVTPLDHARRAMKGFEGSKLVVHSGFGHGAFASPSTCVQKFTTAYFAGGTMPEEEESHCVPDLGPWELAKARNGSMYGAIGDM